MKKKKKKNDETLYLLTSMIIKKKKMYLHWILLKGGRGCRIYVNRFVYTQNTSGEIGEKLEIPVALGMGSGRLQDRRILCVLLTM